MQSNPVYDVECEELVVEAKCKLDLVEQQSEGGPSLIHKQLRSCIEKIQQKLQVLIVMLHCPCFSLNHTRVCVTVCCMLYYMQHANHDIW
jgi:hypothetical protein